MNAKCTYGDEVQVYKAGQRPLRIPGLGKVGDMHKTLRSAFEALQLHKAAKVQDIGDCALVHCTLLWLIHQRGRRRPVA